MTERKVYNKLVRDRIPEIIQANGQQCEIAILSDKDYQQALCEKLVEEAQEAAEAVGDDLVTELADLMEVMDALMVAYGIDPATVSVRQRERREQRGGFERKIKLVWSE